MLKKGELIDEKYRIVRILGKGGTGHVYLAENIKVGNQWAIKELDKTKILSRNLRAEVDILRKLNHSSLPRIVDLVEHKGIHYIVEDYFHGTTLKELIPNRHICTESNVVKWAADLCEVLIYLHSIKPNPIIYRDMKPGNIIIDEHNKAKLVDLGIAREYKEGQDCDTVYIGTRGYAAPEQYSGSDQTDERTDIYGLGATIYHAITGHNPNEPPYQMMPIRQINKNLSEELEKIILKCTHSNPNMRYQKAEYLLRDLIALTQPTTDIPVLQSQAPRIHNKFIIIGSLSPRAGSSFITANLAAALADKGLKVAVIESPVNLPYYFDALFLSHKTSGKFHSYCHEIKKGNPVNFGAVYEEFGVQWLVLDPTIPPVSDWSQNDSIKMMYSVKDVDIVLIDVSINWTEPEISSFLGLADYLFLVVDPDPVLLDRTERVDDSVDMSCSLPVEHKIIKLLMELTKSGNYNLEIIVNKHTEVIDLNQLYLPFKISSTVPYINPTLAYKFLWDGNLLYNHVVVRKLLDKSFQPLMKKIAGQRSNPGLKINQNGLMDKVKIAYKVILGEKKGEL